MGGGQIEKEGDIWQCTNEDCDEQWFHTFEDDTEPRRGYPC
jgi:hypothetical protein